MSFEVTEGRSADDLRAALTPMSHYFGFTPSDDFVERLGHILPAERTVAARDDHGVVIGGAAAFPFDLTVPDGQVKAAGLTFVGVLPTHRRRGILRAMMRAHIDSAHSRGEPVAYLWASEDTIYARYGFGLAGVMMDVELAREHAAFLPGPVAGEIKIVPLKDAEALVAPIYASVAAVTPGMFARGSEWWQTRLLIDPDWRRRGGGELQCAVLFLDGDPAAFAFYRLNSDFQHGVNLGTTVVVEAMGATAAATQRIWRYLVEIDWLSRIRAYGLPLDHPLPLFLAQPRRLKLTIRDGVWIRIVEMAAALSARRLGSEDAVVIEVADAFCPWNAGRWRIAHGEIARTESAADLVCDITALGSVYLGGFTFARLAAALRIQELRAGAIERADRVFATSRAPWCSEVF